MRADRAEAADIIDLDFHKELLFFFFSFHTMLHKRLRGNKSGIDSEILNCLQKRMTR